GTARRGAAGGPRHREHGAAAGAGRGGPGTRGRGPSFLCRAGSVVGRPRRRATWRTRRAAGGAVARAGGGVRRAVHAGDGTARRAGGPGCAVARASPVRGGHGPGRPVRVGEEAARTGRLMIHRAVTSRPPRPRLRHRRTCPARAGTGPARTSTTPVR